VLFEDLGVLPQGDGGEDDLKGLPVGSMTVPSGSSSGPVNVPLNSEMKAVCSSSPKRRS